MAYEKVYRAIAILLIVNVYHHIGILKVGITYYLADQDKSGDALGSVLNVPVLMRKVQGSTPKNLLISDLS